MLDRFLPSLLKANRSSANSPQSSSLLRSGFGRTIALAAGLLAVPGVATAAGGRDQAPPKVEHARAEFARIGLDVKVDDLPTKAGAATAEQRAELWCNGGTIRPETGNLLAYLPATDKRLPSWNLNFHTDTLQGKFVPPHVEGDTIRPGIAGTSLGADDKAGYAIAAEVVEVLRERRLPHGAIRILGLVGEEDTAVGAQLADAKAFAGDIAVSIDGTDPSMLSPTAPTMYDGTISIHTETSHPAFMKKHRTNSACAVGSQYMHRMGFRPNGHPPGHPTMVFHT